MADTPKLVDHASQQYEVLAWPPNLAMGASGLGSREEEELLTRYPQYVIFYINVNTKSSQYITAVGSGNVGKKNEANIAKSKGFLDLTSANPDTKFSQKASSSEATKGFFNNLCNWTGLQPFASYKRFHKAIVLPMPLQFGVDDSIVYNTGGIGGLAGSALKALGTKDIQGADVAKDLIGQLATDTISKMIASYAGNDNFEQSFNKAKGILENPRTEQVFGGVDIRSFTFRWQLVPRNAQEKEVIKNIIATFRANQYPELQKGNANLGAYYVMPNEFDISMFTWNEAKGSWRVNDSLPKIATCNLHSVSVDFTPNGYWSPLVDGSPNMIMLSLTFKEIEPLHRDMIKGGY